MCFQLKSVFILAYVVLLVGGSRGFSQAELGQAELTKALQPFVDSNEVAGAVVCVVDQQGTVAKAALGQANRESNRPMQQDCLFWIASMSKPVTGVCVMMLVDEGKLKLDEPITTYLPEMAQLKLSDGTPAVITLTHLLSHTSGMAELPAGQAYTARDLTEAASRYSKVKINFTPGSKWQYSQTSINTAARIVEVVSGLTFDAFLEQRLCKPLGMKDTTFYLNQEQMDRLAQTYRRTGDGQLEPAEISLLAGKKPTDRDRFPAANGGLFSTAEDYSRFCRMLMNNGQWEGKQILSPQAVKSFRTVVTEGLTTGFTPGNGWGIGCCVVRMPEGVTEALSPGSFGHGGAHGTQAWIDPIKQRAYILMVQRANFPNSDASDLRRQFQRVASGLGK